jgi:hypothetical protein
LVHELRPAYPTMPRASDYLGAGQTIAAGAKAFGKPYSSRQ